MISIFTRIECGMRYYETAPRLQFVVYEVRLELKMKSLLFLPEIRDMAIDISVLSSPDQET